MRQFWMFWLQTEKIQSVGYQNLPTVSAVVELYHLIMVQTKVQHSNTDGSMINCRAFVTDCIILEE